MPRYRVYGNVVGGKYLGEFETATPEAAEDAAMDSGEAYISLCHQCAKECENAEINEVTAEEITNDE